MSCAGGAGFLFWGGRHFTGPQLDDVADGAYIADDRGIMDCSRVICFFLWQIDDLQICNQFE